MRETFVVVGAGQAGGWAAKTLRDQGFEGRIVLIGDELHPPHERPPLSKEVLTGARSPESTYLWSIDALTALDIEMRLGTHAERINPQERRLKFANGESLAYDRLLLATGGRARRLDVPGASLSGVHYLRRIEDAIAIRGDLVPDARLLVVGGGWIGLEAAAAARARGAQVTLVEASDQLCGRVLPRGLAEYLLSLHKEKGVDVRLGRAVRALLGKTRVEAAVLSDGEEIPVSAVIVGVGIVPNVELANTAGLAVDNGIVVNSLGQTSSAEIFAAGDVASHPNNFVGRRVRLESWANAQNQGIAVAKAMLSKGDSYQEIPWFWSDQYHVNLQLMGVPHAYDDVVTRGEPERHQFLQFFLSSGRVKAVAAINNPRDLRVSKRLMQSGKAIRGSALADTAKSLQEIVRQVGG